jgi:molybdopterin-biosynthesis enzyme MoeA-like protein
MSEQEKPQGSGVELHGYAFPGYLKDALHRKALERFATPEEQIAHLIKTVRLMSDRIKAKDSAHKRELEEAKHERDVAVRRLAKAREKMKRLNSWFQYG